MAIPYIIKGILGGMMTPRPAAVATTAPENSLSYPREKDWNGHGTYCGAGCGAGTGDRTIEQAGSDDGTGDPPGTCPSK